MNIRTATPDDAEAILSIYGPYIEKTAITFEYAVPSVEEFRKRIENTLEKYPYLVMEEEGLIIGYAYASQFHTRRAFIYGSELSVYVDVNHKKRGVGKALYDEITRILLKQNVLRLYACIAVTGDENDPYLTNASVDFHEKEGFLLTARHQNAGYKFGRWYDIVWMEKVIGDYVDKPKQFIPFSLISPSGAI